MAKFRVLGGDFKAGRGRFTLRSFSLPSFKLNSYFETISLKNIVHINRAPLEMVALIINDQEQIDYLKQHPNEQAFIATLKDKRRFVGVTKKEIFTKVVEAHRTSKKLKATGSVMPSAG